MHLSSCRCHTVVHLSHLASFPNACPTRPDAGTNPARAVLRHGPSVRRHSPPRYVGIIKWMSTSKWKEQFNPGLGLTFVSRYAGWNYRIINSGRCGQLRCVVRISIESYGDLHDAYLQLCRLDWAQ